MPDLTGTRQSRRDGFIDNGSGTAMQPTPRDELRDYQYCASMQVLTQLSQQHAATCPLMGQQWSAGRLGSYIGMQPAQLRERAFRARPDAVLTRASRTPASRRNFTAAKAATNRGVAMGFRCRTCQLSS
jgi:hypothetical protein